MAVHYVLDGYNIILQVPNLAKSTLEESREALRRLIESQRLQGSARNKVTVVFDGQSGIVGGVSEGFVRFVFSVGETADDRIKKIVSDAGNKKAQVVVTDDRSLRYYVRSLGARVMNVREFLSDSDLQKKSAGQSQPGRIKSLRHKKISPGLEQQITGELKKVWLKRGKA